MLENPFVAAARELLEETGISSIRFVAQVFAYSNASCRLISLNVRLRHMASMPCISA